MKHATRLVIYLETRDDEKILVVVCDLPDYCASTFHSYGEGLWYGEFEVSCPLGPKLAEGDFVEDLSSYFPALLRLKAANSASFELHIAVGGPAEETFDLAEFSVALLAALGAQIRITTRAWLDKFEESCDPLSSRLGNPDP